MTISYALRKMRVALVNLQNECVFLPHILLKGVEYRQFSALQRVCNALANHSMRLDGIDMPDLVLDVVISVTNSWRRTIVNLSSFGGMLNELSTHYAFN